MPRVCAGSAGQVGMGAHGQCMSEGCVGATKGKAMQRAWDGRGACSSKDREGSRRVGSKDREGSESSQVDHKHNTSPRVEWTASTGHGPCGYLCDVGSVDREHIGRGSGPRGDYTHRLGQRRLAPRGDAGGLPHGVACAWRREHQAGEREAQ